MTTRSLIHPRNLMPGFCYGFVSWLDIRDMEIPRASLRGPWPRGTHAGEYLIDRRRLQRQVRRYALSVRRDIEALEARQRHA